MTLTRAVSVVWGRQKSEEEGLRSEWWLRKWIEGAIFHPWLGFDVKERDLWTQGAQEAKKKVKFVYMQKVQCGGQEEKVLDSKMFSRTVKEWAEWFWVNSQKGELINRKDGDTLETTEVRMRIHQGVVTRQEREGSPKQCPLSVLSLTKTPRLQLLKMKRAEVK